MKKGIIALLIIGLVGLTAWKLSINKKEAESKIYKPNPAKPAYVTTVKLEYRTLSQQQSYLGTFEPIRENKVSAETQGKVVKVGVNEGQFVKAGQLIAQLDNEMMLLQLEALQINLEGQQKDVDRYTNLAKTDAAPAIQLEKAELGVKAIKAQMNQIKKQIKNCIVVAPFSGIVTMRMFDLGTVVSPGVPLVQITDISSLKLVANVPERDLKSFGIGQNITVKSDVALDQTFPGKVVEIAAKGDPTHNFAVKIQLASKNILRAGMYGSIVKSTSNSTNALSVDRKAFLGSPKEGKLFIAKNGKAVQKIVQTGAITDQFVEILSGIDASDHVIVSGHLNLQDGNNITLK
jgi:RND family efflux transporter MFP subunit